MAVLSSSPVSPTLPAWIPRQATASRGEEGSGGGGSATVSVYAHTDSLQVTLKMQYLEECRKNSSAKVGGGAGLPHCAAVYVHQSPLLC